MIADDLTTALRNDRYPRTARYDPHWIVANLMGPHPLWLAEVLTNVMSIKSGLRVLDLGHGQLATNPGGRPGRPGASVGQ
ncbi:hypothetical protein [Microlunatus speluncae]|uniref:hypothetical protein n=1 Tax=Microlunatus speluncae TaxID=2594267 RepID=UPI001FE5C87F|nr:hypothetical protein [Microlunatus speluncae]